MARGRSRRTNASLARGRVRRAGPDDVDPAHEPWEPCTGDAAGTSGQTFLPVGAGSDGPMHWQYFGEVRPDVLVEAWLADGTEVPVVRLGWLWIVEYPDRYGQALFVRLGDDVEEYRDWLTPRVLGDD